MAPKILKLSYLDIDAIHFKKEEKETLKVDDAPDEMEEEEYRVDFDQGTMINDRAQEKRRKIEELSKRPDIYELLARSLGNKPIIVTVTTQLTHNSLAPNIFELDDVKKGLLCQLFGGTNKVCVLFLRVQLEV